MILIHFKSSVFFKTSFRQEVTKCSTRAGKKNLIAILGSGTAEEVPALVISLRSLWCRYIYEQADDILFYKVEKKSSVNLYSLSFPDLH